MESIGKLSSYFSSDHFSCSLADWMTWEMFQIMVNSFIWLVCHGYWIKNIQICILVYKKAITWATVCSPMGMSSLRTATRKAMADGSDSNIILKNWILTISFSSSQVVIIIINITHCHISHLMQALPHLNSPLMSVFQYSSSRFGWWNHTGSSRHL